MATGLPPNEKIPHQDRVASTLATTFEGLRFAYVFGSAARGELRPDSDYDVALDVGRALEPAEILELSGQLESIVTRRVDVVDLLSAGPVLKMQILSSGHLIVCRDQRALADFQMYTPSQYEDWKYLSRPLEEALIRRIQS